MAVLEAALGHRFCDPSLLSQALTHSSQAREKESLTPGVAKYLVQDNEQMEFLGDAILSLVTSEELYRRFPDYREGALSKLKAHLVSEKHLVRVARKLELGGYLRLGWGEEKSGGRAKTALLADALEAVMAAIYLDGGFELAREFVLREVLAAELSSIAEQGGSLPLHDFKSALQEQTQDMGLPQPSYVLVKESGPEHRKMFTVEARVVGQDAATGLVRQAEGETKKAAEQGAARQLLEALVGQQSAARGNGECRDGEK